MRLTAFCGLHDKGHACERAEVRRRTSEIARSLCAPGALRSRASFRLAAEMLGKSSNARQSHFWHARCLSQVRHSGPPMVQPQLCGCIPNQCIDRKKLAPAICDRFGSYGKVSEMLHTLLIILLILFLLGALGTLPTWPHSRNWGYGPSGGLGVIGLIVLILVILMLLGRI